MKQIFTISAFIFLGSLTFQSLARSNVSNVYIAPAGLVTETWDLENLDNLTNSSTARTNIGFSAGTDIVISSTGTISVVNETGYLTTSTNLGVLNFSTTSVG